MTDVFASDITYRMFRNRIRAYMERTAALLRPDPQMVVAYIHEEDDNISFRFRYSHSITVEVRFEILDYAAPFVHGGLFDERKGLGLKEPEDDEHYGEKGNFCISLVEDGVGPTPVIPFYTPDGWVGFSDVSEWERRFGFIETTDREMALAIREWFEAKRQEAAATRLKRR